MIGECRERRYGTGAVFAHILEHRREHIHAAGLLQCFEEEDESAVNVGFEQIGEFLHVEPGYLGILRRLLHHADDYLR